MLKQLRIKFVCATMLVVTLMLCIICGLILNSTSRRLEIQSLQLMQDPALLPRRGRQPNAPPTFEGDARIPFFVVDLHTDGTIRETFSDYYDLSDEQFLQEIVALAESSAGTNGKLEDYSLRYNRISMPKGETIVFMDTSGEEMMMRSLLKNCTLVGGAAWQPAASAAGDRDPAGQCRQIQFFPGRCPCGVEPLQRPCPADGIQSQRRAFQGRPAEHLQALLPSGQSPHRTPKLWPWPLDRRGHRPRAPRPYLGRLEGRTHHLLGSSAPVIFNIPSKPTCNKTAGRLFLYPKVERVPKKSEMERKRH